VSTATIVIGAGLTGLSAAWHAARRGVSATVLERAGGVGGACASRRRDGFEFDLTGHLLHLARTESEELLAELGVTKRLRRHRRRAGIALAGTVTPYPIQIHTHRLPPEIRRDCLLGFIEAWRAGEPATGGSFADWVRTRFGEGLARHFFFPYNRKLFCTDPEEMTADWVGRYVPRPSLEEVVDGAFGLHRGAVGYNATFLYPRRGGIRLLADALAEGADDLRLDTPVRALRLRERELELGDGSRINWTTLIATLPLTHLAEMALDLGDEGRRAAAALRAVAVTNLNLGVAGRAPRREHWLYVPEPRYPFYRVGFPSNHGDLAPPNHHTISVEVSVPAGQPTESDLQERCLDGLEELGLLRDRGSIVVTDVARIDPAYVVFDTRRRRAVAALRELFREHGVLLCGRWAEWKYSTMEDALLDGASAARRVVP